MTHRRLILAFCVAVVAPGAWWWFDDRLMAQEQQLIGSWGLRPTPRLCASSDWIGFAMEFQGDRRLVVRSAKLGCVTTGYWHIREGQIVIDRELNYLKRTFRPLARFAGLKIGTVETCPIVNLSADELAFTEQGAQGAHWDLTRHREN